MGQDEYYNWDYRFVVANPGHDDITMTVTNESYLFLPTTGSPRELRPTYASGYEYASASGSSDSVVLKLVMGRYSLHCAFDSIAYGLYKISVTKNGGAATSLYIDFLDGYYGRVDSGGYFDIYLRYNTAEPDSFRAEMADVKKFYKNSVMNVWDEKLNPDHPGHLITNIIPDPPPLFAVAAYSGHPKVTWNSYGVQMTLDYSLERKLNSGGSFSSWWKPSNSGYPNKDYEYSKIDYDLSGAGSGSWTVYYRIRGEINGGVNTLYDTVSINYAYLEKAGHDDQQAAARKLIVSQNYHNPFNPSTSISFVLPENEFVEIGVYDMLGREVRNLVSEPMEAGSYSIMWDGQDARGTPLASGIYVYRVRAGNEVQSKRMILLK